jgi:hypothetical protein
MKKIIQLAIMIGACATAGIANVNAQSTNTNTVTFTTNVVLNLNIALTGFTDATTSSTVKAVRITDKDILTALTGPTVTGGGTVSNSFTFGRTAKLIVISGSGNGPAVIVRETISRTNLDTDVSAYFTITQSDKVGTGSTRYSILTVAFDNGVGTDFTVSGFATEHRGRLSSRAAGILTDQTTSVTASVAGTGHGAGAFSILRGTVGASGAKIELD